MQMLLDAGAGVDAKSNGRLDEKIEKRMGLGQRERHFMIFHGISGWEPIWYDVVDKNDTNEDDVLDVDFYEKAGCCVKASGI